MAVLNQALPKNMPGRNEGSSRNLSIGNKSPGCGFNFLNESQILRTRSNFERDFMIHDFRM
jgi:hypothetical protein